MFRILYGTVALTDQPATSTHAAVHNLAAHSTFWCCSCVFARRSGACDAREKRPCASTQQCRFNRTENVRPIPPADPDFARLYARRNDAESINRHLDDTLWLGRAHSVGHARQHLNLIGFALCVNSVALHEHRRRRPDTLAA